MRIVRLSLCLAVLAGCDGAIGDPGGIPGDGLACDDGIPSVGSVPLRRLTHREYARTVRDLLGYEGAAPASLPSDNSATGYSNQSSGITATLADAYMRAAESITAAIDVAGLSPCDPTSTGEDECARQLIAGLGKRAYRRPLTTEQSDRLFAVFSAGRDGWGYDKGVELVVQALLQSPSFLYRVELGGTAAGAHVVALDSWEMATRLSYFLWGTMPDDALFAEAEADRLRTPEQIEAQAKRMLADPRAREAVQAFHEEWLDLRSLELLVKDAAVYPEFNDAFKASALTESQMFLEHVVFDGAGDLDTILLGGYSFVDATLANLYGVAAPATGFEQVTLPAGERAGILTHASLLAVTSKPNQTSPVVRGKLVRELLLCELLPEPPPDVDTTPPAIDPSATTRERFTRHMDDPMCSSCHSLMDPIGFGFENYDAIGRWRTEEGGLPIDASGVIAGSEDVAFHGAVELAKLLVADERVHRCFVKSWLTWSLGRAPAAADGCSFDTIATDFVASGRNVQSLLLAITRSEAFRYRPAIGEP
jgi:uncharacterized protein DUF1592/uncharacterized protein DUF1588/uncharacterized protein DUF1595/uncharacterized protein DUF1585/uncharacterized protein DUF1587